MKGDRQRIFLATGNAHKVQEFQQLAEKSGLAIEFSRPAVMPAVVEDTGTFVGNARKKAYALRATLEPGAWVLADDSGLCVDALGGAPGVESAYFAGPEGNPRANLAKLVDVMKDVPDDQRAAQFVCVLFLVGSEGNEQVCEGICRGRLARGPAGGSGFGYDPVFVPEGYDQTYSELGDTVKNKISHRGRAWLTLTNFLGKNFPRDGVD